MHVLNNLFNWFSTFADVYFTDVSAPLESIVIWGPMRGILKKTIKASKTKKARQTEERKTQLGQMQTQYAKDLYSK